MTRARERQFCGPLACRRICVWKGESVSLRPETATTDFLPSAVPTRGMKDAHTAALAADTRARLKVHFPRCRLGFARGVHSASNRIDFVIAGRPGSPRGQPTTYAATCGTCTAALAGQGHARDGLNRRGNGRVRLSGRASGDNQS